MKVKVSGKIVELVNIRKQKTDLFIECLNGTRWGISRNSSLWQDLAQFADCHIEVTGGAYFSSLGEGIINPVDFDVVETSSDKISG